MHRVPSVTDYGSYLPTETAVEKAVTWQRHGAEICYLSFHRTPGIVDIDRRVLLAHGFPTGQCSPAPLAKATPTWHAELARMSSLKTTARVSAALPR